MSMPLTMKTVDAVSLRLEQAGLTMQAGVCIIHDIHGSLWETHPKVCEELDQAIAIFGCISETIASARRIVNSGIETA